MKKILIVTALIVFSNILYSQGFTWDERSESHHKTFDKVGLSRSAVVPSSFSLEKYLSHTMNQGASDMCAAYSIATCRTILYARNNDLTDADKISAEAYSPYYIYYKYKYTMGHDWEGGFNGLYTDRINQFGYAKMKDIEYPYYYPFTEHNLWNFSLPSYVDLDIEAVKEDKFDNIYSIYASEDAADPNEEVINQMKTELSKKRPILFGFIPLPASWNNVGNDDYWSDTIRVICRAYDKKWKDKWLADEECKILTNNPYAVCDNHRPSDYFEEGGHAMVVIAYDDEKYGGSFQILNSWGEDWGDNGKVWVPYHDFIKYSAGIQSFDKEKKSIFNTKKSSFKRTKKMNFPAVEIGLETKDFSSNINFDWIMFAQMTIEGGHYSGKKDQGLKHGNGTYTLPNGIKYEGNWKNDKMHGEGKLTYQSMYEYNGEFKDGSFHGEGILTRYDGFGHIIEKSDGRFENGEFIEGYLIQDINRGYWIGCRYEGNFEDGYINGNGKMITYGTGTIFEGEFFYGYCRGNGTITYRSATYNGEWLYSYPHGKGIMKFTDGSESHGNWSYGKLLEEE